MAQLVQMTWLRKDLMDVGQVTPIIQMIFLTLFISRTWQNPVNLQEVPNHAKHIDRVDSWILELSWKITSSFFIQQKLLHNQVIIQIIVGPQDVRFWLLTHTEAKIWYGWKCATFTLHPTKNACTPLFLINAMQTMRIFLFFS